MKKQCYAIFIALLCICVGLTGCKDSKADIESQAEDIKAYNQSVENIANSYSKVKEMGDDVCGDIRIFVTTNVISDKLYNYLKLPDSLPKRESGESDTEYKSRCAEAIFDSNTVLTAFDEWKEDEENLVWMFDSTYVWRNSYYVSVASEYTRQFMVIKSNNSNATAIVNAFWKDNKIHKIIVSHYT